jgi:hypothetical protein
MGLPRAYPHPRRRADRRRFGRAFLAPAAHATAPGDNGTVKIHDAQTGEDLRRNEPHV